MPPDRSSVQSSGFSPAVEQASSLFKAEADYSMFLSPEDEIDITRRNLPHWRQGNVMYFITFRQADSIPRAQAEQLTAERKNWKKHHQPPYSPEDIIDYNRLFSDRVETWLHAGTGSCTLADPENAKTVGDALRHFNNERYTLDEWVVMSNHVHVLVKPVMDHAISAILHSWKSYTANIINKHIGRTGQFWQHESYDHIVRNEEALLRIREYIKNNPGKAGIKAIQSS